LWYGEALVSRVWWAIIHSKPFWMALIKFKFLKIISSATPGSNLDDDGGYNRTMIRNTRVEWPNNSCVKKFLYEEWEKSDTVVLNHLIKSMKSRCLALIESKGRESIINCDTFIPCTMPYLCIYLVFIFIISSLINS
jgi:hypothetical protein